MFAWLIYVDLFQIAWPTSPGANRRPGDPRWSKRLFGTCLVHLWDQRSGVLVESDVTKMQWVSGILMGYDCFFRWDIDGIFMGLPSGNDQQFAIENCHRNSWFTHQKWWCSTLMSPLPILDTLQTIKFFAGERRYSHTKRLKDKSIHVRLT